MALSHEAHYVVVNMLMKLKPGLH